jgi:hypothetical protein
VPLINSTTKEALRANTDREISAGKKPAQAYAIAQSVRRRIMKRRRRD